MPWIQVTDFDRDVKVGDRLSRFPVDDSNLDNCLTVTAIGRSKFLFYQESVGHEYDCEKGFIPDWYKWIVPNKQPQDPETVLMSTGFVKRFHVNKTEYQLTTLLSEVNPCAGQEEQWPLKIVIKNVNYKYRIESAGETSGPVVDEIHGELFVEVRK